MKVDYLNGSEYYVLDLFGLSRGIDQEEVYREASMTSGETYGA